MHQMAVVRKAVFLLAVVILSVTVMISPSGAADRQEIVIFHAGSLKVPLAEMEKRFEKQYPSLDIVREFGGSTKMARMIMD